MGQRGRRQPPSTQTPALTNLRQQVQETRDFVAKYQDRVLDLLAQDQSAVKRFYQTFSICLAQEPKLATCTRSSLIGAMLEIASLKLEPGVQGEAWLIPFKDRKRNVTEATVIVGYKGMLELARRAGNVGKIDSEVVYEKDSFDWLKGTRAFLDFKKHVDKDRGRMIGAWAEAEIELRLGTISRQFEVMLDYEIVKIRDNAPSAKAKTSPWRTDEEAMWRKTVLRRLCKFLPSDPQGNDKTLKRAVELEDRLDAGRSQDLRARADDLPEEPIVETTATDEPDHDGGESDDGSSDGDSS